MPCALQPFFTQDVYHAVLTTIYDSLPLHDIISLLRVNRHTYTTFIRSSRLQLRHRRTRLSVPADASFLFGSSAQGGAADGEGEKIKRLEEREKALNEFRPSKVETVYKERGKLVGFEGGVMVFECKNSDVKMRKKVFDPGNLSDDDSVSSADDIDDDEWTSDSAPSSPRSELFSGSPGQALQEALAYSSTAEHCKVLTDGWEVYRVNDGAGADEDSERRGGIRDQGMFSWKVDLGRDYHFIGMCAEDNVVAVVHKGAYFPYGPDPETCALSMRMYFFTLVPPLGTPIPPSGIHSPIPHPDAHLPFIEILIPMTLGGIGTGFDLGPGGRMSLLLSNEEQSKTVFAGVWDWKSGVCLGCLPPDPEAPTIITSINFLGPFVIASCSRRIPASDYPEMYAEALENLEAEGDHPISKGSFAQLSFSTYTLLLPSMGYPPHSPSPPDQNPFAAPYPDTACSWSLSDIPMCVPVGIFKLPFEDLVPFTLDLTYLPGNFSILECHYRRDVHNDELNGLLLWKLSGRTSIVNLNTILSFSTAFARARMADRLSPETPKKHLPRVVPRNMRCLSMAEQAELAAEVLGRMENDERLQEDGTWLGVGMGVGVKPRTMGMGAKRAMRKRTEKGKVRRIGKTRATPSSQIVVGQPDKTTSNAQPASAQSELVHCFEYDHWEDSNHIRMECAPSFSSVYGAREVRLVTMMSEDELVHHGQGADKGKWKMMRFILCLNDYNARTVLYPTDEEEEEQEKMKMKQIQQRKSRRRSPTDHIIDHTSSHDSLSTSQGPIKLSIHQSLYSEELGAYVNDTFLYERTAFPNNKHPVVLKVSMDLRMMPGIKFDGRHVLLSGFVPSAYHILTF